MPYDGGHLDFTYYQFGELGAMAHKIRLMDVLEGNRYQRIVLIVSVVVFFTLELLIYLAAAGDSGLKSKIIVSDANGVKIYETLGNSLTSYQKATFEGNYGPLSNYQVHLQTENSPFPFRAWVSAAVGIPVGFVLLVSFLVRVYLSLLYGDEKENPKNLDDSTPDRNRFGSFTRLFQGVSIFHVGFLVVFAVLLLWMLPNFIGDFGKMLLAVTRENRWFVMGTAVFLAAVIVWVIYLRYRLSRQMLDNQLDFEKFRLEKQLLLQSETTPLLPNPVGEVQENTTDQSLSS